MGNARQAAYYYRTAFGMKLVAYAGPETGLRDRASYVLQQGKVRFVFTTALRPGGPIAEHVASTETVCAWLRWGGRCAPGVASRPRRGGRTSMAEPTEHDGRIWPASPRPRSPPMETPFIPLLSAAITTARFCPASAPSRRTVARPTGLKHVDHMVGNVGWHAMDEWVNFYANVMGFQLYQHFDDKDISTEYSALMSKVMSNGNGYVKFPINEPAEGRRRSQIEEYLDFYQGPGVQHIALATDDILATVSRCRRRESSS